MKTMWRWWIKTPWIIKAVLFVIFAAVDWHYLGL